MRPVAGRLSMEDNKMLSCNDCNGLILNNGWTVEVNGKIKRVCSECYILRLKKEIAVTRMFLKELKRLKNVLHSD